jgi:hypothetical protein
LKNNIEIGIIAVILVIIKDVNKNDPVALQYFDIFYECCVEFKILNDNKTIYQNESYQIDAFLLVALLKFVYFWSTIKDNEQKLINT